MRSPVTIPVEVPLLGDERNKNWAKVVQRVDVTKSNGWAFEGEFIAVGGLQDVPAGSVVLVYGEKGSRANPTIESRIFEANADGTLTHHATAKGRAWARTLRDRVARLLAQGPVVSAQVEAVAELLGFGDEQLLAEIERRGYRVLPKWDGAVR